MQLKTVGLAGVGLLVLLAIGPVSWLIETREQPKPLDPPVRSEVKLPSPAFVSQSASAGSGTAFSTQASATKSQPGALAPESSLMDFYSAYRTRDLYPVVVALRQARQRGTFAASFELQGACMRAMLLVSRPPMQRQIEGTAPDENAPAGLKAKQEIEVRCGRFSGQDSLDLGQPLPGDAFGDRYRRALNTLTDGADAGREILAVSEIVAQGMGATDHPMNILRSSLTWKGESWKNREAEFHTAVSIAVRMVTASPASGAADLRDLISCYSGSPCTDFLSSTLSYFPADRRPIVEALARDMATAIQVGNVPAWQTKTPPAKGG